MTLILETIFGTLAGLTWLVVGISAFFWAHKLQRWFLWLLSASALYQGVIEVATEVVSLISMSGHPSSHKVSTGFYDFLNESGAWHLYALSQVLFGVSLVLLILRIHPKKSPDGPAFAQPE